MWRLPGGLFGRLGKGFDRDVHAVIGFALELHAAIDHGEDGVILAEADIGARLPPGAALADDDVAGDDGFTAVFLDAKAAAFGVAPVAG